jgi:hypothetical protein
MSEWTVTVDTAPSPAVDDGAVDRVRDALNRHAAAIGASVHLGEPAPNLIATFRVEAGSTDDAVDVAFSAFAMALEVAGVTARCGVSDISPAFGGN